MLVASEELFKSEYAERRLLPMFIRPVAVSTVVARAVDLESPERIAELRKAVKVPEGGDKSYFFLILSSGDMTRYYPFRIATPRSNFSLTRRHDALSVVALNAIPPMLNTITTMSQSGRW